VADRDRCDGVTSHRIIQVTTCDLDFGKFGHP
jgi:hypothetical protein